MKFMGIMFICAGFACWFIGARSVIDESLKRQGIKRDWEYNPFAPFAFSFRKFSRREWSRLAIIIIATVILFNIGQFLLMRA